MASAPLFQGMEPYIMRLPVELHNDIIDVLPFPDQIRLKLTSRYFSFLIKRPTHQQLLHEEGSQWATSTNLFTCMDCIRLRPALTFSDAMRKGKRSRHGKEACERFCIDCGLGPVHSGHLPRSSRYTLGTEVAIMGRKYICWAVANFSKVDKTTLGGAPLVLTPLVKPYCQGNDNNTYDDDYDWWSSTRAFAGDKHHEEFFGLWQDY